MQKAVRHPRCLTESSISVSPPGTPTTYFRRNLNKVQLATLTLGFPQRKAHGTGAVKRQWARGPAAEANLALA